MRNQFLVLNNSGLVTSCGIHIKNYNGSNCLHRGWNLKTTKKRKVCFSRNLASQDRGDQTHDFTLLMQLTSFPLVFMGWLNTPPPVMPLIHSLNRKIQVNRGIRMGKSILQVYQYCLKIWYLRPLQRAGVIQKVTILERKNGLVLANTRVPVSGTWSILFQRMNLICKQKVSFNPKIRSVL